MKGITVKVLEGKDKGRVFADLPLPLTIGREQGNVVRLDDDRVSRFHAKIQLDTGELVLTDLESTNGTQVNGNVVKIHRLQAGDRVALGRTLLGICLAEHQPEPRPYTRADWQELRGRLSRSHVFDDQADLTGLHEQLLCPSSEARQILGEGFYRLVLLDAATGSDAGGKFDLERFLVYAREELARAFDLNLARGFFHLEDVGQVLKDEPRSLFCFVNLQNVSGRDLRRLRGFTQEQHQALFTCRGRRDLAAEERAQEASLLIDSSLSHAVAQPFDPHGRTLAGQTEDRDLADPNEPLPPLPRKLGPAQAARLAELLDLLLRGLADTTESVDAIEENSPVALSYPAWQRLLAVQMLLARYQLAVCEPDVLDE